MKLPEDILKKINELFPGNEENLIVWNLINEILQKKINVGHAQLIRSVLILSEGDKEVIRKLIQSNFNGDPRDVIMEAGCKEVKPGHYFIPPFK